VHLIFLTSLHIDFDSFQNCATMNCQRNINSTLPTQLPHKFSYIVAILGHNHFESPNMLCDNCCGECNKKVLLVGTVGGQIKLGHLKFNLCKSDH
jgi:hypothetical protein